MDAVPKTMLLTASRPGAENIGGIFLRDFCKMFPRDRLVCFHARPADCQTEIGSPELSWLPMESFVPPPEALPNHWRLGTELASIYRLTRLKQSARTIARKACQYAVENDVENIWVTLSGPSMILLAKEVARKLGVRLSLTIWDPPEYVLSELGYSNHVKRLILQDFEQLVRTADACGVASDGMQADTARRFDKRSVVLINSVDRALWRRSRRFTRSSNEPYTIVFAGSLYAEAEFLAFVNALNSVGWKIEGRDLVLKVMAHSMPVDPVALGCPEKIQVLGFRKNQEALDIISGADVAYLPYWLDTKFNIVVQQSFPNKMSAYLAAGCPVFFHGPVNSTPARFLERYPVGLICNSPNSTSIIDTLKRFILASDAEKNAFSSAIDKALEEELNPEESSRRLADLLGVKSDLLIGALPVRNSERDELSFSSVTSLQAGTLTE